MFESGFLFKSHKIKRVCIFFVHRDSIRLTCFVAKSAFANAIRIANKEQLLDPTAAGFMKGKRMRNERVRFVFACIATHGS